MFDASSLWARIDSAELHGLILLLALLLSFFAGVFFTLRRLRLEAKYLWRLILAPAADAELRKE